MLRKLPKRFYAEPDDNGGDTSVIEPPAEGGGFQDRMRKLMDGEPVAEPAKETPTPDLAAPSEKTATPPEKPKKEAKPDPLLGMLDPAAKESPKVEPTADPTKEAEIAAATKGMSGKAADNFRTIAKARDEAQAEAAALRKELESIKGNPQITPEIKAKLDAYESLQQERDQLNAAMEKLGAERSPAYQNKFVKGRQALVEKAKGLIARNGGDASLFEQALGMTGSERAEAMSAATGNMAALDANRVAGLLTDIEALDEDGKKFIENARESLINEEREAQQQELRQREELARNQDASFTQVINGIFHKFPDDHPLAAEANPMVDAAVTKAREFMAKETRYEEFVKAAAAYAVHDQMKQRMGILAQKLAEAEEKLAAFEDAEPDLSSGGGGPAGKPEQKGLAGRFSAAMAGE